MSTLQRSGFALSLILLAAICVPMRAISQHLTTLHSFGSSDGNEPSTALTPGEGGVYYGTTRTGGPGGTGTVFELYPNGATWNLITLHTFSAISNGSKNADGADLITSPTLAADGNLYCTTRLGGIYGNGTLYKITPDGVFTKLHDFSAGDSNGANQDGANPCSNLIPATDGNLYGTAYLGGVTGHGTIYRFNPADGTLTTVYAFSGPDGAKPFSGLMQAKDGYLYGTAGYGGGTGTGANGTVFRCTLNGNMFTTLYRFSGSDGSHPLRGVIRDDAGNLYGTTLNGGPSGNGVVFKLDPTNHLKILHSFSALNGSLGTNPDGANPHGGLVQDANTNLWGTTESGGINGTGTYYRISPNGVNFAPFPLTALDPSNHNDSGAYPHCAPILDVTTGNIYITATAGGANGAGTIDQITPDGLVITAIHSFTGSATKADGANPQAALVEGSDHFFYGTTLNGGANGTGAIFKIASNGPENIVYSFTAIDATSATNADGAHPRGALLQTKDGTLYGTASSGGPGGWGTVFNVTLGGSQATLYGFSGNSGDGATPVAGLIADPSGKLVGTTRYGGAHGTGNDGFGTCFTLSAGNLTYLTSFAGANGAQPSAGLVQDPVTGTSYGTCSTGGTNDSGTVFKISKGGVITTLYEFSLLDSHGYNADGANPVAALILSRDGNLYGTTQRGGTNGTGTVFRISKSGTLFTLYTFSTTSGSAGVNSDGANPSAALVEGKVGGTSGNFYGTTAFGGPFGTGTIFQLTPSGKLTTLNANNTNTPIYVEPYAPMIQGTDGNFYGTTSYGGASGQGTVFCLDPQAPSIVSLSPSTAKAGSSDLKLVIRGAGYQPTSAVNWNGSPLATTYVSGTQLKAVVPASLLSSKGKASVTVVNSTTGSSNVVSFVIK